MAMVSGERRRVPVRQGLFADLSPGKGEPQLIASQCCSCGEIAFPKLEICPNCQSEDVREIKLSRKGKIYSVTVVMQRPPIYYKGPVPYALGFVEFPEGVRIEALLTGANPETFEIGMEVELFIEKLQDDEQGNELICYKFKPASKEASQ